MLAKVCQSPVVIKIDRLPFRQQRSGWPYAGHRTTADEIQAHFPNKEIKSRDRVYSRKIDPSPRRTHFLDPRSQTSRFIVWIAFNVPVNRSLQGCMRSGELENKATFNRGRSFPHPIISLDRPSNSRDLKHQYPHHLQSSRNLLFGLA